MQALGTLDGFPLQLCRRYPYIESRSTDSDNTTHANTHSPFSVFTAIVSVTVLEWSGLFGILFTKCALYTTPNSPVKRHILAVKYT